MALTKLQLVQRLLSIHEARYDLHALGTYALSLVQLWNIRLHFRAANPRYCKGTFPLRVTCVNICLFLPAQRSSCRGFQSSGIVSHRQIFCRYRRPIRGLQISALLATCYAAALLANITQLMNIIPQSLELCTMLYKERRKQSGGICVGRRQAIGIQGNKY